MKRHYYKYSKLKYWVSSLLFFFMLTNATAAQFNARLEWVHRVELRVLDNGVINKVYVKLGQHVQKGQILVSMDQREFKASLVKHKALLEGAKLNLEDAKDELERAKELYDRGLIADEELKDAKLKHAASIAELESSKASLTLAELALERSVLRAPISGIITIKNAWKGGVVYKTLQSEPLIAMAPIGSMLARVLVNSDTMRKYKPGQAAKVIIRGKTYPGKIYSLGVEAVRIDPTGAVYELDIIFKHPANELLRPSQTVKVILP